MPITAEERKEQLTSQMRAFSEFYQAFNGKGLKMMAQNWAPTDGALIDNPVGGVTRG